MGDSAFVKLPADTNQALGIARYAIDFLSSDPEKRGSPDASVLKRANLFQTDAVICGLSALALRTVAPNVLRDEALSYPTTPEAWSPGSRCRPPSPRPADR